MWPLQAPARNELCEIAPVKQLTGLSWTTTEGTDFGHDERVALGGKHSPPPTLVLVKKPVVKHGSGAAYNFVVTFATWRRSRLGVCINLAPWAS